MSRLFSSLLLSLGIASSAAAVAMDWTPIGDPGNACDPQGLSFGELICLGSVGYSYNVGTYEVTNAQYAEFLNAKAAADPLGLYDTAMSSTDGSSPIGTTERRPLLRRKPRGSSRMSCAGSASLRPSADSAIATSRC